MRSVTEKDEHESLSGWIGWHTVILVGTATWVAACSS